MSEREPDNQLLERFANKGDDRAFDLLVRRHLGLVLAAARRRLAGREALAEEVAQNVFVILARKAKKLRRHPCVPAWLQRTATFEALRMARKESNHSQKIGRFEKQQSEQLQLERAAADAPPDPQIEAALPVLDNALAALGDGDRRALMWRFYEEKSFKAIAQLSGKSEAACQKQARRAIDKLGAQLRRRGVALPTAVIASSLAAELGRAAPADALSAFSNFNAASKIGTAATSAAAGGMFLSQLAILMNTKSVLATGAAILLACAGTGFVAGKVARPTGQILPPDQATVSPSEFECRTDPPREEDPYQQAVAEADPGTTLRNLLQLAAAELRREKFDLVAGARARARVACIPPDQITEALEIVAAMEGGHEYHKILSDALLAHWATTDGATACEYCLQHRSAASFGMPPIHHPLTAWAERDPQAAFDWYLAVSEAKHPNLGEEKQGRWSAISSLRWVMGAWAQRDLDGAVAAYKQIKTEFHQEGARIGFQEHAGTVHGREKLLEIYLTIDGYQGRDAVRDALGSWSRHRPEELATWLDEHRDHERLKGIGNASAILRNWLLSDHEAALEWWFKRPAKEDRESRTKLLLRYWEEVHPEAAGRWAGQQENER